MVLKIKKPPEQLPIVLQVLHSQCHRFRALVLLGRFLDMGSWAVDLAYVLKLLQTTTPELQQILVFIWTKILALDKDGGHTYFIRFLDSVEAYSEQCAMAAFVLAVIVDGHRRAQEACIEAGLVHLCLKHLQSSISHDTQTEPLFLQWLCLCLGKLWEDLAEARIIALQADAPVILRPLLAEPQPEVRAAAVFALGAVLGVGFKTSRDSVGDEGNDDDEKLTPEVATVNSILGAVSDGSPLVRAEVAIALSRFAFVHNKNLKLVAAAYCKSLSNSIHSSLYVFKSSSSGYTTPTHYVSQGSVVPSVISSLQRVGSDSQSIVRDGRVCSSRPLANAGVLHGSPLSDDLSQHSDSDVLNDGASNGVLRQTQPGPLDNALYSQCILAMFTLANDPSPRVPGLGKRVLSTIGIEQVVARSGKSNPGSARAGESTSSTSSSLAELARSSSWFDMNGGGHMPLTFKTPRVSPPQPCYLRGGLRRVCSLEFRPHLMSSPDSGLADPLLVPPGGFGVSERSFLPQSTIYNWSCGHFSNPLLSSANEGVDIISRREEREKLALEQIAKCQHSCTSKLHNQIASWDTKFETGAKTALLQPFAPVVIASDENERIRVWNYEEAVLLNCFDNHAYPDKGISKLCLLNELDESLLLVASSDGNVRIWKDYSSKNQQKLVSAFSAIQGLRPGIRSVNAVVDWQQQSGILYTSGEISSIMAWDLDKEQFLNSIPSSSDCCISALATSQVHGGQFAAGFIDGSVRLFDIRTPEMLVAVSQPHIQKVERVAGIGFQPGLEPAK